MEFTVQFSFLLKKENLKKKQSLGFQTLLKFLLKFKISEIRLTCYKSTCPDPSGFDPGPVRLVSRTSSLVSL